MSNMEARIAALTLVLGLIFVNLTGHCCYGQPRAGFYVGKCPDSTVDVEAVVRNVVKQKFDENKQLVSHLLRMHFHDCFVRGCDASILLNGTNTEKTAPPNLSVRGYEIIDAIKDAVEKACPERVSCADIIALATRDAVSFANGAWYPAETGRLDGLVSIAKEVNLPAPTISITDSIAAFDDKGLNVTEMVYLLAGHTVGKTHCGFFQDRLYQSNPNMDPALLATLRNTCPQDRSKSSTEVFLDQNPIDSTSIVDKSYLQQILQRRGILQVDHDLAFDSRTKSIVETIANKANSEFLKNFGEAMIKMGRIRGSDQGEIRKSCAFVNPKPNNANPSPKKNPNPFASLFP